MRRVPVPRRLLGLLLPLLASHPVALRPLGQWQLLATSPKTEGRSECGVAAVQGRLYVLGGDGPAQQVQVLEVATARWQAKAPAPVSLHHFQAVAYHDQLYVLAAFSAGGFPDQEPADHAYRYDPRTDAWQTLAGLPAARRRASAGASEYGGKLYVVAGIAHGHRSGTTNQFDVYDPRTDTWAALPDAPHPRDHCQAVVLGGKLYVVGGRNTSYHEPDNFMAFFSQTVRAVDCYDFASGHWSTLAAALPLGTGGGSAAVLDGKLFYAGGERATTTLPNRAQKDVYYLDPTAGSNWVKAADLHLARNGVGSAVIGHRLYVAGGVAGPPPGGHPPGAPPASPPPTGRPPGPPAGGAPGSNPAGLAVEVFHW